MSYTDDLEKKKLNYNQDLNYNSYLKVPDLLNLQTLLSEPQHHDEMFFIIIHQSMELWFKLILHESQSLKSHFQQGSLSQCLKRIQRMNKIIHMLRVQIETLNTLTPVEFAGFRDQLRPASGFQSLQYRKIEFSFGIKDSFFLKFFKDDEKASKELKALHEEKSLYQELLQFLGKQLNIKISDEIINSYSEKIPKSHPDIVKIINDLYYNQDKNNFHYVLLCEALLDFDELFIKWRNAHIHMVSRTIGIQKGTGGSSGHKFLSERLNVKFFPDLWEARNNM